MKSKRFILHLLYLSYFIFSCSSSGPATTKRRPKEVKQILLFQPLSAVYTIEKGNKKDLSVHYSDLMMYNIWDGLEDIIPSELDAFKIEADSAESNEIAQEIYNLGLQFEKKIHKKSTPVSDKLISILEKHNYKYGIGTISFGFTRTRDNLRNQYVKGIGIALLSYGITGGAFSVMPMPVKSNSTVICFIIDKEKRSIIYYKKDTMPNQEPTNPEGTDNQIRSILNGYFGNLMVKKPNNF